jgi:hypothetical protein
MRRYSFQQNEQSPGSRRVVQPLVEGLLIFDAAQHVHSVAAQPADGLSHVLGAKLLDQQVRREVAAHRDHGLAQLPVGEGLPDGRIDLLVGVVSLAQLVGAAVDDARELVLDGKRIVEPESTVGDLTKQLDHHRHLHRARRVEALVRIDENFIAAVQGPVGDRDLSATCRDRLADRGFESC